MEKEVTPPPGGLKKIFNRSSLFTLLLVGGNILVVWRTYQTWEQAPLGMPQPARQKISAPVKDPAKDPPPLQLVSAQNIVEKNLFDPDRGTTKMKDDEAGSVAMQRIRGMVLVGTVIFGEGRYAILRSPDSPAAGTKTLNPQSGQIRVKLNDTVEGFKLSEIDDRKVAFTKGNARVDIALDFFRGPDGRIGTTRVLQARSQSPFPEVRRDRLPPPPAPR